MTSLVESYFGLKRPPFSISGSSGPVLMTESLRSAAVFLRAGLENGTAVLGVTGAAGIGKSSLARSLAKLTRGDRRIAMLSGRAKSWEELRTVLKREFEIGRDRITRDGLAEARAKYGKLLIVVDDAQYLSANLLERICVMPQLRTDADEPAVQLVLLADLDAVSREDIRPLLAWLDVKARHVMQPLPAEGIHRYLDTRLRRVGWKAAPLVCESGALALHRLSLGNPRRLSTACMEVLAQAATRRVARIDAEFVVGCSIAEMSENEEPLLAPSGAALTGEFDGEPVKRGGNPRSAGNNRGLRSGPAPLRAKSTAAVPSLELEHAAKVLGGSRSPSAPIESIRYAARPMLRKKSNHLNPGFSRQRSRGGRRGLLFASICALVASAYVYTARLEVADLLRGFGMNLLSVADAVETAQIGGGAEAKASAGAVERLVALELSPASDLTRY